MQVNIKRVQLTQICCHLQTAQKPSYVLNCDTPKIKNYQLLLGQNKCLPRARDTDPHKLSTPFCILIARMPGALTKILEKQSAFFEVMVLKLNSTTDSQDGTQL